MSETSNPYNEAMQRLKSLGGFYEEHVDRTISPVVVETPRQNEVDVNFVPAAIGAAAGIPQAIYRTLRPSPAPSASVADIARTVATEAAPMGGAPSGVPLQRATDRKSVV